eukprot:2213523-Pleurochrysis_carterae.AAC.1
MADCGSWQPVANPTRGRVYSPALFPLPAMFPPVAPPRDGAAHASVSAARARCRCLQAFLPSGSLRGSVCACLHHTG